ncbi:MAG TPA: T9SS type A sorting domain-containing protein, partial [Hanamia sp.]
TILRTRGKLYAPGIEAPSTIIIPANSFASIGNPYASAIDFDKVYASSTGISHSYIIWDPQLTTAGFSAYGYGGFRTISGNVAVPQSGNYLDGSIPPIQSGQAFFVQTIGAAPGTVSFNETCKISGSTSIFRAGNTLTEPMAQLRGNLFVNYNGSWILIDGVLSQFHPDYAAHLDSWDAIKMGNAGENMGIESNGKTLAIERRPLPSTTDTLFYNLNQLSNQPYLIEFIATRLDVSGLEAFLEDNYLHTQTILKNSETTLINFAKDNLPDSYAPNRFHIVFKPAAGALPVTFTNVKAYTKNGDIVVEWKVENEKEIVNYILETSVDGSDFHTIATVALNSNLSGNDQWLDVKPIAGYHYYRIKINERNGRTEYSQIMKVFINNDNPSFSIYPNPAKNGIINLYFKNQPAGWYHLRLYNTVSHLILLKKIRHAGGSSSQILSLNTNTKHGVYHLKITKPDGEKVVEEIAF